MTAGCQTKLRHAALELHALAPADADWVLGRLGAAAHDIRPLLAELGAIRFPAVHRPAGSRQLERRQFRQLEAVLANEPALLRTVAAEHWPATAAGETARPGAESADACAPHPAPRLRQAVQEVLSAHLANLERAAVVARQPWWWRWRAPAAAAREGQP